MNKEQSKEQSKKRKEPINKVELWNIFDAELGKDLGKESGKSVEPLECMYRACGNREKCDCCEFSLAFSEEGYLTCVNPKCGIIYKDMVDQGAEWRYYGADDSHNGADPTRCGMPINPLLQESSFGCKVLSYGSTSYEMRKGIKV